MFDDAGALQEWVGVCIDIEDRKQAELERLLQAEAVRQSEHRFRTLVESVAAIVWRAAPSGGLDIEQPAWTRFTGQDLAEHAGNGWLEAVHPDDRAATMETWSAAYSTTSRYEVEHRLRRADGTYVPMIARAIPLLEPGTGEVREWIGFHTDVSELRRAERELRLLTAELERRVEQRTLGAQRGAPRAQGSPRQPRGDRGSPHRGAHGGQ